MLFAEWDLMGLSGSEVASVVYEPEVLRPNRLRPPVVDAGNGTDLDVC